MSSIQLKIVDNSLKSSSAEPLRTITSNYYQYTISDYGAQYSYANDVPYKSSYVSEIKTNFDLVEEISETAIFNSYKFPVRVFGDVSKIIDDANWSKIVYGGNYGDNYFNPIYNDGIYSDNVFSFEMPYSNFQAITLYKINNTSYDAIKVKPVYNYSIIEFEEKARLTFEKFIPNIYFFQQISDAENDGTVDETVIDTIYNSVTFNNRFSQYMNFNLSQVSELLIPTEMSELNGTLPPEESLYFGNNDLDSTLTSDTFYDLNYNLRNYMSASYVQLAPYDNVSDTEDSAGLSDISNNYIFDDLAVQDFLFSDADVLSTAQLFPYYINIEIPIYEEETTFRDLIATSQAVQPLMAAMAKTFNEGSRAIRPSIFDCSVNRAYY